MASVIETPTELPNPFIFSDGTAVRTAADWERRRGELLDLVVDIEYGGLPPAPDRTECEALHTANVRGADGVRFVSNRVVAHTDPPCAFMLHVLMPPGDGPFPVVLTGDACWRYVTDKVAAEVLRRGFILAQFNRVEIVRDMRDPDRRGGLFQAFPEKTFGALAAWAWGYHRCVDALARMSCVDAGRIAIVGHSRGGKTALLAGATDTRIAVTSANDSGCGGAGCFRFQGPRAETIADITRAFPNWFAPRLKDFAGRETELPFDQHFLKALIAPRALLTTEALGDLWANPTGTWQTHLAAREVYRFLNAEECIGIWHRKGGHAHGLKDWRVFLDFAETRFGLRRRAARGLNRNPFPELKPAFSWRAHGRSTTAEQ